MGSWVICCCWLPETPIATATAKAAAAGAQCVGQALGQGCKVQEMQRLDRARDTKLRHGSWVAAFAAPVMRSRSICKSGSLVCCCSEWVWPGRVCQAAQAHVHVLFMRHESCLQQQVHQSASLGHIRTVRPCLRVWLLYILVQVLICAMGCVHGM